MKISKRVNNIETNRKTIAREFQDYSLNPSISKNFSSIVPNICLFSPSNKSAISESDAITIKISIHNSLANIYPIMKNHNPNEVSLFYLFKASRNNHPIKNKAITLVTINPTILLLLLFSS